MQSEDKKQRTSEAKVLADIREECPHAFRDSKDDTCSHCRVQLVWNELSSCWERQRTKEACPGCGATDTDRLPSGWCAHSLECSRRHRTNDAFSGCEPTRCEHDVEEQWRAAITAAMSECEVVIDEDSRHVDQAAYTKGRIAKLLNRGVQRPDSPVVLDVWIDRLRRTFGWPEGRHPAAAIIKEAIVRLALTPEQRTEPARPDPEEQSLFYGCVACADPIATYGMCCRCSNAFNMGAEHERKKQVHGPRPETPLVDAWKDQDDKPLPEDDAIHAAFPTESDRHDLYQEAMRLVGARYSKSGLIALVNWLLHRVEAARTVTTRCASVTGSEGANAK